MEDNMMADTGMRSAEAQARRLERVQEQLSTLFHDPDVVPRLRSAPDEQAWSALQVVGHMVEMIPYWLQHCDRMIAARLEPPRFGRGPDAPERLAGVAAAATSDAAELLAQLQQVVAAAAKEIRQMTEAERSKTGVHVRLGTITVADAVEQLIVGHAEAHVIQVREALKR